MSRGPSKFSQRELTRAIKATQKAGVSDFIARVTPTGAIEIETSATAKKEPPSENGGEVVL